MAQVFKQMTIIGLGLIGSSIARAVREKGLAGKIIAYDTNELSCAFAKKEKIVDSAFYGEENLGKSVENSDLVIIATPPASLEDIAEKIKDFLASGAIVMDMASVKQPAITAISPHIPKNVIFIPAHPIAGSEKSGVGAGKADLFVGKRIIITPEIPPEGEILEKLIDFWHSIGARLEGMPADIHDNLYAYMSHLPQLIGFCIEKPLGKYFGENFDNPVYKSFIRLAGSPPELWAEIFASNSGNVLPAVDRYIDVVSHVYGELKNAPKDEENKQQIYEELAYTVLFPRIVASCLVTTFMEAEKKAGFAFYPYAGTGFADISAPAIATPEEDIEKISTQYEIVGKILGEFIIALKNFRGALASNS